MTSYSRKKIPFSKLIENFHNKHNEEFRKINGCDHYDYSLVDKDINVRSKIIIKCIPCNYSFSILVSSHKNGRGCRLCKNKSFSLNNEIVDKRLLEHNRNIKRLDDYINSKILMSWQCTKKLEDGLICNHIWKTASYSILNDERNCPKCAKQIPLTNENVDKKLIYRKIKRLENIIDSRTKIYWQCMKEIGDEIICNYKWRVNPNSILRGSGCPSCKKVARITNEIIDIKLLNRKIKRLDSVVNSRTLISWQCLIENCKYIWFACSNNILNGYSGCPRCDFSKGEEELERVCNLLNEESFPEKPFEDCRNPLTGALLYFDRWIPSKNALIEYQGEFHYQPVLFDGKNKISLEEANERLLSQQYRDNLKVEYCKEKGINLIVIPHWDFDKIEEILKNNFL